ncbi:hypothetical protein AAF712_014022 [Marasmius tenuissimus]|uniref:Nephrocystin 3-like N-terminal domain-containing protein n=1 Tax=Marasmius tenuissimus TaxID=585030 RepID=A0ABR2ZE30_9AGAR
MKRPIQQRISKDPKILEAKLEDQFRELILKPTLKQSWYRRIRSTMVKLSLVQKVPNVVIIDGLDECGDEDTQIRILSTILSAYQQSPDFPLRFLICSRPESWIRETFAEEPLCQLSKVVVLDESFDPDSDITRFYLVHFQKIATSSKYDQVQFPSPWPSKEDLEALVARSCGQFIYAMTVIKFIKLANNHPIKQLRIILDNTPGPRPGTSPYHELDALYHVILITNPDREQVMDILAAIIVLEGYLKPTPACIELLLGMTPGEVALALRGMHSVLNIRGWTEEIVIYHTSFRDYLIEKSRSGEFHIDMDAQRRALARRWLYNISATKIQAYSFDQLYGEETNGFFTGWIDFCGSIPEPTREMLEDLRRLDLASLFFCKHTPIPKPPGGLPPAVNFRPTVSRAGPGWFQTFSGLDALVRRYPPEAIEEHNTDSADLVQELTAQFSERPKGFHLDRGSNVPLEDVQWTILLATGCSYQTHLTSVVDRTRHPRPSLYLIDCTCNHPVRTTGSVLGHFAYDQACVLLVFAFFSQFEALASKTDDEKAKSEVNGIFGNLVDSALLRHCRVDRDFMGRCQTFFESALSCSLLEMRSEEGEERRKGLLEWIETFPEDLVIQAEMLKTQVIALMPEEGRTYRVSD